MQSDASIHSLLGAPSRRDILRGLAGAGLGLSITHVPAIVGAKNKHKAKHKHKRKTKKPTPNAFGCLDVGQLCRGNSTLCCSGVCGGKKPKKGEKDKRTCIGHNVGGCIPERSFCFGDPVQLSLCNPAVATAVCFPTTGNAGFCGTVALFDKAVNCQLCSKDNDCETAGFPPGSACVVLDPEGINCGDVCAATENRACVRPGI